MSSVGASPDRLLTSNKPPAHTGDATAIAASAFGVTAMATPLAGERDANFHLAASDGRQYVLKFLNAEEEPGASDLQSRALQHVASRDPALPTPRVRLALDGRDRATAILDGMPHTVRLLTFLEGEPLYKSAPSREQAAAIGVALAALDLALSDFHHAGADRELLWDIGQAPKLRPLLGYIADPARRALATEALDRYESDILPHRGRFRRRFVHNDFNPHNILVDPKDPAQITGVLDFGDMVETALVNDVAIAATYQVGGEAPLELPCALVAAFHTRYPLEEIEIDAMCDLVALRHMVSVTIAEWRASLYPANAAYILRNHARAATGLRSLAIIGRREARRLFRQACGLE
jgi:hydroxylysine kinase